MHIQEQGGHLGLMRLQCHCKPWGFKQGCEEGFMIQRKISNGFLPRNTGFKRGQSFTKIFSTVRIQTHQRPGFNSNRLQNLQTQFMAHPKNIQYSEQQRKYCHARRGSSICSNVKQCMLKLNIPCLSRKENCDRYRDYFSFLNKVQQMQT